MSKYQHIQLCRKKKNVLETLLLVTESLFNFAFCLNDKILGLPNFICICRRPYNVTQIFRFAFDKVENIVGEKGENASYQHFLLFPEYFQNASC